MIIYHIILFAAIFILMVVAFRLVIHFYFCRRVSPRYPGKKLAGCPIWTRTKKVESPERGENEESTAGSFQ